MFIPADALRGKRFCPGEKSEGGDPLPSLVMEDAPGGGGANADPNLPMVASAADVVVVIPGVDDEAEDEKKGRKAAGGKGSRGSTKWCNPNGL